MAYIAPQPVSTFERNRLFLIGQGPSPADDGDPQALVPLSSGGGEGGGAPLDSATQPATPSPQAVDDPRTTQEEAKPASQPAPQPGAVDFYDESAAGGAGSLLNPFAGAGRQQVEDLYGLSGSFYDEAGPSRSWEGIGGAGTIQTALDPDAGEAGRVTQDERARAQAQAREFVKATYGGPAGLDLSGLATVKDKQAQLEGQAGALRTGSGIAGTLRAHTPGLTPGMARYDAQQMIADGVPTQVVQNVMPEVRRIGAQVGAEERAATDFAKQRTQEETGIRTGARAALEGARRDIYGDVDEAVLQAQDQNADLQALYDEAKRTGSFEALDAIPGVDAGAFNTPGRQAVAEAEQRRAEIMGDPRFAAVADIPPLELTINKRGREKFSLAGDESDRELWKEVTGGDLTREEFKLLKERQQALEAYFSPGSKKSKEGALSTVAPLYHGEDLGEFAPADYRPYIGIDPGVAPERENLATTDQRYVVNMASDLLGEAERLDDAGEPFRAAAVFAQGQKYLEDEARELEARKETLDEREKTHLRAVNKARKKYKKAMHQRPMLKVGRIISSLPAPGAAWIPNTGMDKLIQTGIEPFVRA